METASMKQARRSKTEGLRRRRTKAGVRRKWSASGFASSAALSAALSAAACLVATGALSAWPGVPGGGEDPAQQPTLDETRLTMGKWIETQQIISKERNEWQQGKEILLDRLDLVRKEVAQLEDKIEQAESGVAEADKKREELQAESDKLKASAAQLTEAVTRLEGEVRKLFKVMPEPIRDRVQPLFQRIPDDPTTTRATYPERFQNVLGILNELNKANNELTVGYEVHTLADGKPSEVRAVYAGLAQAWYVSASGEAGIGRPGADGWTWEPSKEISGDVSKALEILQGKHSPEFVGLPVRIQ
jgi:hypothetical protein